MKSKLYGMIAMAIFVIGVASPVDSQAESKKSKMIHERFKSLDVNGNKSLSEREFVGNSSGESRMNARKQFRSLDTDSNKSVSFDEFKKL